MDSLAYRREQLSAVIISQDNRYQFFTAGDSEKKEVLNRITNADMINPILDKLLNDKKRLSADSNEISSQIGTYEGKLQFYREQRAEAIALDDNHEISEREKQIKMNKDKIQFASDAVKEYTRKLESIKSSDDYALIDNLPNVSELEERRKKIRSKIKSLEEQESEAERIIKDLKADISGAVECPECGHKFMPESNYDLTIEQAKKLIKDTEESLESIRDLIGKKKARLRKVNESIDEADQLEIKARRAKQNAKDAERDVEEEKKNVERFKKRIADIEREIADIKKNSRSAKTVKRCDEKIKEVEQKIKDSNEKLSALNEELSMVEYWSYYMGKNGFATYLANRSVKIIEGITNSFLKKFRSSMTVEINGFKINKDGSVREKIDVLAVYKGKYAQNFMGYSGGERSRIFLASILGIQHLINLSADGKGLDLLLLDESLGALDSRGVVNICNILNQLGVTVMMITQNVSNDVNISNKVLVIREDEVSKIFV